MGHYETIIFEQDDFIATITLNRPQALNAINREMDDELEEVLEQLRLDEDVRVIILKGAGRAFCSGHDLKSSGGPLFRPPNVNEEANSGYMVIKRYLLDIRKPIIASVHGYACGAGFALCMACDFRIAAEGTKFGSIVVKRGLGAAGTYLLPRMIGLGRAREWLYTGDFIVAEEAERLGLVNRVVREEERDRVVADLADRFAKAPTKVIGIIKTAMNQGLGADVVKGLEYQALGFGEHALLEDPGEGIKAFLEKREPSFTGK